MSDIKRITSLLLAGAMSITLAACGGSSEEAPKGDEAAEKPLDGTYVAFDSALEDSSKRANASADELIAEIRDLYSGMAEQDFAHAEMFRGVSRLLLLSDGKFTAYDGRSNVFKFEGSYSENNGALSFNYDKMSKESFLARGAEDDPEGGLLAEPEVTEFAAGNDDKAGFGTRLSEMSKSGTYITYVGPQRFFINYITNPPSFIEHADGAQEVEETDALQLVPAATGNTGSLSVWQLDQETYAQSRAQTLTQHGDFLCGSTVGWTLEGEYTPGETFTITYDPAQTLAAAAYPEIDAAEETERWEAVLGKIEPTTVTFSNGRWKWTRSDGTEISVGEYSESSEFEGFIVIRPEGLPANKSLGINEYIYISGSDIYYPYALRME